MGHNINYLLPGCEGRAGNTSPWFSTQPAQSKRGLYEELRAYISYYGPRTHSVNSNYCINASLPALPMLSLALF